MNVKNFALPIEVKLEPHSTIRQAVALFNNTKLHGIPIVGKNGEIIGIFTRSNLYQCLLHDVNIDSHLEQYYIREAVYFREDKTFKDLSELAHWLNTVQVGQTPVVDMNNRPIGVITQAWAVIELLNRYEYLNEELLNIMEKVPAGIIATDGTGKVTIINDYASKILHGINIGGHIGDVFLDLKNDIMPVINGAWVSPRKIEYKSLKLIVSIVPIFQDYKMKGAICVLQDLTDFERIAYELQTVKELKETLETVLEVSFEGVAILDVKRNVTFANSNFCEYLGKGKELIIGQNIEKLIPECKTAMNHLPILLSVVERNHKPCVFSMLPYAEEGDAKGFVVKIYQDLDQLSAVMAQLNHLNAQLNYYKEEFNKINGTSYTIDSIVSKAPELSKLKNQALQVARSNSTVLITGESGTGKELFAHGIHNASVRSSEPFIKVNCSAIPSELAESELFGYEDGAFTGARKQGKPGKFEMAKGGTIFLDEIGDMPLLLQSKLLRVIQEKEVERVGGVKTRKVDVRIIAATNRDLTKLVGEGKFRQDLYFRLNVVELHIPPLRERKEDISLLVDSFIGKFNKSLGKSIIGITDSALKLLLTYRWPGNIRELQNVIERIFNYVENGVIDVANIPVELRRTPDGHILSAMGLSLATAEQEAIHKALIEADGNKAKAARILGISRSTLYQKLLQFELPSVNAE